MISTTSETIILAKMVLITIIWMHVIIMMVMLMRYVIVVYNVVIHENRPVPVGSSLVMDSRFF